MNLHTFKDAVKSKRSSLANELDDGDEDDDKVAAPLKRQVEGEEDEGEEKVSIINALLIEGDIYYNIRFVLMFCSI